jgi:hypothetical protein
MRRRKQLLAQLRELSAPTSDVEQLLREPSSGTELRSYLATVIAKPSKLVEIGKRSFFHSNGFSRLVLETYPATRQKLRLHYWDSPDAGLSQDPHNHAWSFVSCIMAGQFVQETYSVTSIPGSKFVACELLPNPPGFSGYKHRERYTVSLVSTERRYFDPGDVYRLGDDIIHKFYPIRTPAFTIVVQLPSSKQTSLMYIPAEQRDRPAERPVKEFDSAEVVRILSSCLSMMN